MQQRHSGRLTTELSDVGGLTRLNWQQTWPARIRSSDLVKRLVHKLESNPLTPDSWTETRDNRAATPQIPRRP